MNTPAAALAWELWRRHRPRVIIIIGLVLGFAVVYPKLCALAGFNPTSPDVLDELVKSVPQDSGGISAMRIVRILLMLFLACGPTVAMFLSLLCVVWMSTFTEFDSKTREPMKFPARLFTLPVSTPFLFWWLFLAGMASVILVYGAWVYLVPLPHLDIFGAYQNCFGWMTMLALAQGIVWALAAWPLTRMMVLTALFGFIFAPGWQPVFEWPFVLPLLFLLGLALARAGMQKMRHGQWQGWAWEWPFAAVSSRAELRGPRQFASPAQAQLWFEWRRFARRLCYYAVALAWLPVAIHLLVRLVAGLGPLQDDTVAAFVVYLLLMPLGLHLCFAIAPPQSDLPFQMIRPMTTGGMLMAALKAAGIGTIFSWGMVLTALCAMPLLGHFPAVDQEFSVDPPYRAFIVLGLMLLTWRLIAINLCFVWSGNRRLAGMPVWLMLAAYLGAAMLALLAQDQASWNLFWRLVPALLTGLIVVKFLLAFLAFRVSLKRGLLAPSSLRAYLAVWVLLVAALLIPAAIHFHGMPGVLPLSLAIVLLTPLARIGFCPIALSWNRHA